jgi:uncharacterized phiE125 gp8 family phage protein
MAPHNAITSVTKTYTGTPTEPVTLADAKAWCKVDDGIDDDALITSLVKVARLQLEKYTGISLVTTTIKAVVTNLLGNISLPYGPYVSTFTLKDSEGTTIDATGYTLTPGDYPQLVEPCYSNMTAEYSAGFTTCPDEIKTAVKMQVAFLYENRGDGKQSGISPAAAALVDPLKRIMWT